MRSRLGCRPTGYLPFARSGGQLLFHLVSKLYERTSVIITTNLAFGEWPKRGPKPALANPVATENAQLKRDYKRLERAEAVIEIQKTFGASGAGSRARTNDGRARHTGARLRHRHGSL